jgi:hypothetical protein
MTTTSTRPATDTRVRDDRRRAARTTARGTRPDRPTETMQRRLVAHLVG